MEYVKITEENLEREHICCALSNNNDPQVLAKKTWMKQRLAEGLTFVKADVRGKCFIEYIPAEYAWVPIEAKEYMHINCFWVSGSCKGHGYGDRLLEICIEDARAKGKKGLTVISSAKKKSFLSDPGYLRYRGFVTADEAEPFFQRMCQKSLCGKGRIFCILYCRLPLYGQIRASYEKVRRRKRHIFGCDTDRQQGKSAKCTLRMDQLRFVLPGRICDQRDTVGEKVREAH